MQVLPCPVPDGRGSASLIAGQRFCRLLKTAQSNRPGRRDESRRGTLRACATTAMFAAPLIAAKAHGHSLAFAVGDNHGRPARLKRLRSASRRRSVPRLCRRSRASARKDTGSTRPPRSILSRSYCSRFEPDLTGVVERIEPPAGHLTLPRSARYTGEGRCHSEPLPS